MDILKNIDEEIFGSLRNSRQKSGVNVFGTTYVTCDTMTAAACFGIHRRTKRARYRLVILDHRIGKKYN
ncbi:hypothetical protein KIN20_011550 [Parelaphostrongylus tenuis]|uniref:Uncharacterized protein n=1 Tax=Parelaphostrongylus tenuis TaxID=148309 RepID=A0AAD5QJS1_PARTN|nr:hypothetical protein KIN20_011550 [Parelaphostrongylus tenuis]